MLSRLADRLVLRPTTDAVPCDDKRREQIQTPVGEIEAWVTRSTDRKSELSRDARFRAPDQVAIKFPGTAGRAERGGPHPFELDPVRLTEIWTINHVGYGGSQGKASLDNFAPTCDALWQHIDRLYPNLPIWLVGNSLGCVSALYLSARNSAAGMFLRNPVPIHELIAQRPKYNWWNFGWAGRIAGSIASELNAVENSRGSRCPALFVRCENDTVVPTEYQQLIRDSYAGPHSEYVLERAEHHHPVPEHQIENYTGVVRDFLQSV